MTSRKEISAILDERFSENGIKTRQLIDDLGFYLHKNQDTQYYLGALLTLAQAIKKKPYREELANQFNWAIVDSLCDFMEVILSFSGKGGKSLLDYNHLLVSVMDEMNKRCSSNVMGDETAVNRMISLIQKMQSQEEGSDLDD